MSCAGSICRAEDWSEWPEATPVLCQGASSLEAVLGSEPMPCLGLAGGACGLAAIARCALGLRGLCLCAKTQRSTTT